MSKKQRQNVMKLSDVARIQTNPENNRQKRKKLNRQ